MPIKQTKLTPKQLLKKKKLNKPNVYYKSNDYRNPPCFFYTNHNQLRKEVVLLFLTFSLFVGIIVRKRATADFISDVTNTIKGNLFLGRKYELCLYYIIRYNFVSQFII